jgi:putative methionine-R-sulfoxide reductase with GAF domain
LNPDFKVDTVATRAALAGESGQATFTDFRGLSVLGVWSPLEINAPDTTHPNGQIWAIIAKLDESEALAPVNALAGALGLIIGLAVLGIGALAVFLGARFAIGFVTPILSLTNTATQVAAGNMNLTVETKSADEIGILSKAFNTMTSQLRDLIGSLEERVAARTKDLATVAEVGTATATILETDKLLQEVVNLSKERFNLYHSHIYLLDESGQSLVLAAGSGEAGRQMMAKGLSIPLNREQSLVARAAREQKGVTVNDVTQAPDFLPNPLLPDTRSELAVPMIVGGNVIGVFDVQSEQAGRFTDSDINIQTTLAAQVSTSIQNVRSFEQAKSQADLESLVNSIGQKIQRSTTVEDTLQTAIREIGLALGASRVSANIGIKQQNDDHHAGNN